MSKPRLTCLLLLLGIGPFAATQAADTSQTLLYRYIDSRGVTVLDRQGVPPEYVAEGYEVLNAQGRVVQVVPPAPTADEIHRAQVKKEQASADAQLLNLYSSVEDVDRAKARKLAELDSLVSLAQGNLKGLTNQQASLQGQAADLERAGKPVPQSLVDQMDNLRDQQQSLNLTIQRYLQARSETEIAFDQDRARVEKLSQ